AAAALEPLGRSGGLVAARDRISAALRTRPRLRKLTHLVAALAVGPPVVASHILFAVGPRVSTQVLVERARQLARVFQVNRTFERLHTNGCGDFTLLDRETWFRLRGYPEWSVFSWGIDSVFLFQADANHVRNVQWPEDHCTYHVDHGGGWS